MKSKKMTLLMVGCLTLSTLTGCSLFEKKPTAEDLVSGISTTLDAEKGDISLKLTIDMSADMGELMDGATMDMGIELDAAIQYDSDTMYMNGDVGIDVLGMNMNQEMKTYQQKNEGEKATYNYDPETDTWTYSIEKMEEEKETTEIDPTIFENLTLSEIKKEDTEYVVTGVIDFNKISELIDMDTKDFTNELTSGMDIKDMKMDLVMNFDRKTKTIKTMKMTINPDSMSEIEGAKINEFVIELIINTPAADLDVKVPDNIIRDSIEDSANEIEYDIPVEEPVQILSEDDDKSGIGSEENQPEIIVGESTGKYSINSFKEFINEKYDDMEFYDFQSEYGYVSTETEIYGDNWVVDIELSQFDTEELAKEEWEWSFADDYEKEYLEDYHAKDDAVVDGYSNKNTMYWAVDGDRYDTRYAFLDGNTIIYITGYVFDWDHTPTEEEGIEMRAEFDNMLKTLGCKR